MGIYRDIQGYCGDLSPVMENQMENEMGSSLQGSTTRTRITEYIRVSLLRV